MEESNKLNIIDVLKNNELELVIIWDSNIYNNEEKRKIIENANNLNYSLIDTKLSNMIKVIEVCKELINRLSKKLDDGKINPLVVLKENSISNEYIFKYPDSTLLMYNLIKDELKNNEIIFLAKTESTINEHIYLNYLDFINLELPNNINETCANTKYLEHINNYEINYVIPTYIDIMKPKIKYEIERVDNNILLKSKQHSVNILLVDDVNNQDIDIYKYDLILEVNNYDVPTETIIKEETLNEIYKKHKNPLDIKEK